MTIVAIFEFLVYLSLFQDSNCSFCSVLDTFEFLITKIYIISLIINKSCLIFLLFLICLLKNCCFLIDFYHIFVSKFSLFCDQNNS